MRSGTGRGTGSRPTDRSSRSSCPTARSCWPCGWGAGSPTGSTSSPRSADIGSGCRPTRPRVPRWSSWNISAPGAAAGSPWKAPRLPDDAVVLQTLWEARLPWDRALLGVPPAWSDDNEWAWAGPLFVRRPGPRRDGPERLAARRGCPGGGGRRPAREHPGRFASPLVQPVGPASGHGRPGRLAGLAGRRVLGRDPDPRLHRDLRRASASGRRGRSRPAWGCWPRRCSTRA